MHPPKKVDAKEGRTAIKRVSLLMQSQPLTDLVYTPRQADTLRDNCSQTGFTPNAVIGPHIPFTQSQAGTALGP